MREGRISQLELEYLEVLVELVDEPDDLSVVLSGINLEAQIAQILL